ncbi:MAG: Major Facilitator Superfamily protein [Alphaproteobacteria bacterium ADurb.Bin438]|nr:MAG: Major Facilitator Superfamily protein [Alphaproteobacteria bacterium ADurb.Bin438]
MFLKRLYPKYDFKIKDLRRSIPWLHLDGVTFQFMETWGIGIFLIAYALQLKANYFHIGILLALPYLGNLSQLVGAYLVEKYRKRKLINFFTVLISRSAILLVSSLVFFKTNSFVVYFLIFFYMIRYFVGNTGGSPWNSWMRDLIPRRIMGRYFARRLKYMTLAAIGASAIGAFIETKWKAVSPDTVIYSYALIIFLAALSGFVELFALFKITEPPMPDVAEGQESMSFLSKMKMPFNDMNYRKLMVFIGLWNFAIFLAFPFFGPYLLDTIKLDASMVSYLTILSQITNVLVIGIWGGLSDRFSNKSVLSFACPLYLFAIFMWIFTTFPTPHGFTMPLLIIIYSLVGIAQAGVNLSTANIALKLAPSGGSATYLSANGIIISISAGIAPIIGGIAADIFKYMKLEMSWRFEAKNLEIIVNTLSISHWDFLFIFSTLLGLYSLSKLNEVVETGEVEEKIVVKEFFAKTSQSIGSLSNINGVKAAFLFMSPFEYEEVLEEDPVTKELKKKIIKKRKKRKPALTFIRKDKSNANPIEDKDKTEGNTNHSN